MRDFEGLATIPLCSGKKCWGHKPITVRDGTIIPSGGNAPSRRISIIKCKYMGVGSHCCHPSIARITGEWIPPLCVGGIYKLVQSHSPYYGEAFWEQLLKNKKLIVVSVSGDDPVDVVFEGLSACLPEKDGFSSWEHVFFRFHRHEIESIFEPW